MTLDTNLITKEIELSYRKFAKYYDRMTAGRGHVNKQVNLLHRFIKDTPESLRILDAACGRGEVIQRLAEEGGHWLAGSDGSPEMLSYAIQNELLKGLPFSRCYFNELDELFSKQGKFDLVYFLGNALAHIASTDELIKSLEHVFDGLAENGRIVLDFRRWSYDEELEHLIEPGRSIDVAKLVQLAPSATDEDTVEISEVCTYKDGRQIITYTVKLNTQDPIEVEEKIAFSYLPFTEDQILEWLNQIGFARCGIFSDSQNYPYLVAYGQKV